MHQVQVGSITIGDGQPLAFIVGPCVVESAQHALETAAAVALWRSRFAGERFIEIADELPTLRDVQHRNVARIAMRAAAHVRTPTLLVFSAIDNLMKGAAGQAMQNANLMLDLDETMGLPA